MKFTESYSVSYKNLSQFRVLFVGKYTIVNPRTAYLRADGAVTVRAADPKDTMTFDTVGEVWGVDRDDFLPTEIVLVD